MIAGGAFRDPQFSRFFVGVFFAVQAIWVQRVTLAWLAWEKTGSAGFVGLVAALSLSPTLVAGPLFGVMADRVNIRRAALATNGAMAGILAVLALSLPVGGGPWGVAVAALAIGITTAAHHPVRMSLGPRLVPREMVQHVVSVTALNFNLARLVAPVRRAGSSPARGRASRSGSRSCATCRCWRSCRACARATCRRGTARRSCGTAGGVRYAAEAPLIREALILTLIFATLVRGALEVLPVLADGAFGQGAAGLGMLTAAAGAGRSVPPR
jgi:MFS family permease